MPLRRGREAAGIELKKIGKDIAGKCPFHDDSEPSLIVTPAKNLWHCFGCQIGGGPIDWVMKLKGVSFRHAVELLKEDSALAAVSGEPVKRSTVRTLPAPVALDADDRELLAQVVDYYHATLKQSPEALAYLEQAGLSRGGEGEHQKNTCRVLVVCEKVLLILTSLQKRMDIRSASIRSILVPTESLQLLEKQLTRQEFAARPAVNTCCSYPSHKAFLKMKKNHIPIYATSDDWLEIVRGVGTKRPLQLVKAGLFDTPKIDAQSGSFKIESLAGYLVLDAAAEASIRTVPQRNGSIKYAVDQLDNASSVVLQAGGLVDSDRLVSGSVGTTRTDQVAKELFKLFASLIKERFTPIKSYYVGTEALRLLGAGTRLTLTLKSPKEYDLNK